MYNILEKEGLSKIYSCVQHVVRSLQFPQNELTCHYRVLDGQVVGRAFA